MVLVCPRLPRVLLHHLECSGLADGLCCPCGALTPGLGLWGSLVPRFLPCAPEGTAGETEVTGGSEAPRHAPRFRGGGRYLCPA